MGPTDGRREGQKEVEGEWEGRRGGGVSSLLPLLPTCNVPSDVILLARTQIGAFAHIRVTTPCRGQAERKKEEASPIANFIFTSQRHKREASQWMAFGLLLPGNFIQ